MNWNKRVRQTHRVLGLVFAATLIVTIVALALQGPLWVSYLPLLPLVLLLFSGLYLYVLFVTAWRRGRAQGIPPHRAAGPTDRPPAPRVRRLHRWSAAAFVVTVVATSVALTQPEPVVWVSYLPLLPLALLVLSGLAMFALSYRATAA